MSELEEARKRIAELEKQNGKLQYRIKHLVANFRGSDATSDASAASSSRAAAQRFGSRALCVSETTPYASCVPLRTLFAGEYPGLPYVDQTIKVAGWISNVRSNKKLGFIEVIDGTQHQHLQVVVDKQCEGWDHVASLTRGTSLIVTGKVVKSPKPEQPIELVAQKLHVEGVCDATKYPLTKPMHTFEHLRGIAHLRPRVSPLACVTRIRNALAFATHAFYQEQGFIYVHSPIITASDCEGAGEMFQVTTILEEEHKGESILTKTASGDYKDDFFGRPAFLTVSGQLNAEIYACSMSKVYTFGPTFRAENSHTSRHLAEFWMIEPEVAFCEINGIMDIAEAYVRFTIEYVLRECLPDVSFLTNGSKAQKGKKLFEGNEALLGLLTTLVKTPFARCTYTEGIELLKKAEKEGTEFCEKVEWGMDLPTDMERHLAEKVYKGPVFLYNYPKDIKAFYMRQNEDGKTVAAFDLLVPGIGELIGGSQREEREDVLTARIKELDLDLEAYWWYMDLRKFGSVTHSGFGLGFERLVMMCTGVSNIRESIPFPRFPRSAEF